MEGVIQPGGTPPVTAWRRVVVVSTLSLLMTWTVFAAVERWSRGAVAYAYDTMLLSYVVGLVPSWWLAQRAVRLVTGASMHVHPAIRVATAVGAVLAGLLNALVLAFIAFLWAGQRAYSVTHDPSTLPPGANHVRVGDLALLAAQSAIDHNRLRLYLARNQRWFITMWDGHEVAFLRGGVPGARRNGSNGYLAASLHGDSDQYRLGLYLDTGHPPARATPIDVVPAGQAAAVVSLLRPPLAVIRFKSTLWVAGNRIGVEVFDESEQPRRSQSDRLLADLARELRAVDAAQSDAEVDRLLEAGSIDTAEASVIAVRSTGDAIDTIGFGSYSAGGAVNPGEPGWVYVRAFDAATSATLVTTDIAKARERVGWSASVGHTYRYQFEFTLHSGDWGHDYQARIELWFDPDDGGPTRRLGSVERRVRGYQH